MKKNREYYIRHGRAVFYISMMKDFNEVAAEVGWRLALYGTLTTTLDIMAMPWSKEAVSSDELLQRLCGCFKDNKAMRNNIRKTNEACGRISYLLPIWGDVGIEISTMDYRNFQQYE